MFVSRFLLALLLSSLPKQANTYSHDDSPFLGYHHWKQLSAVCVRHVCDLYQRAHCEPAVRREYLLQSSALWRTRRWAAAVSAASAPAARLLPGCGRALVTYPFACFIFCGSYHISVMLIYRYTIHCSPILYYLVFVLNPQIF